MFALKSTKIAIFFLITAFIFTSTSSLNCEEIKVAQSAAKFSLEDLKTLAESEVISCFSLLGKEKLTVEQAGVLWQHVLKINDSPDQIPEEDLRLLGWIARGIPANHFLNMSFTDIDTIAAFGRFYDLSYSQLSSLRDAVMDQWSSKDITDLSSFDLANLGHILCAFNTSDIARIHPDAFRDAASELSLLKNCSADVIKSLARLATDPDGFGDPAKWTALQVSSIGCVIAGVSAISNIPSEAFKGISPDMVDCLPKTLFQSMSEAQLRMLPASSGMAVGEEGLSSGQGDAIEEAIYGQPTQNSAHALQRYHNIGGKVWRRVILGVVSAWSRGNTPTKLPMSCCHFPLDQNEMHNTRGYERSLSTANKSSINYGQPHRENFQTLLYY